MRAVAHHQPPPVDVALTAELGDVGVDLGLQRLCQHPAGTVAHDLVDHRHRRYATTGDVDIAVVGLLRDYAEHGSYLPDRRCLADLA
jgi:hypothetical protein